MTSEKSRFSDDNESEIIAAMLDPTAFVPFKPGIYILPTHPSPPPETQSAPKADPKKQAYVDPDENSSSKNSAVHHRPPPREFIANMDNSSISHSAFDDPDLFEFPQPAGDSYY